MACYPLFCRWLILTHTLEGNNDSWTNGRSHAKQINPIISITVPLFKANNMFDPPPTGEEKVAGLWKSAVSAPPLESIVSNGRPASEWSDRPPRLCDNSGLSVMQPSTIIRARASRLEVKLNEVVMFVTSSLVLSDVKRLHQVHPGAWGQPGTRSLGIWNAENSDDIRSLLCWMVDGRSVRGQLCCSNVAGEAHSVAM